MSSHIAAYDLPLPDNWYWIPPVGQAPEGWQRAMAERLAVGDDPDNVAAIAEQLADVHTTVAEAGFDNVRTAVGVSASLFGQLIGLMTVRCRQDIGLEDFGLELAQVTEGDEETVFDQIDRFTTVLPAGRASGAHVIMGTLGQDELGQTVRVLEERVLVAVAPPNCADLVEVMAIAAGLGCFPRMTETFLAFLHPLTIQTR